MLAALGDKDSWLEDYAGPCAGAGTLFVFFSLPETKGLELAEVQALLQDKARTQQAQDAHPPGDLEAGGFYVLSSAVRLVFSEIAVKLLTNSNRNERNLCHAVQVGQGGGAQGQVGGGRRGTLFPGEWAAQHSRILGSLSSRAIARSFHCMLTCAHP